MPPATQRSTPRCVDATAVLSQNQRMKMPTWFALVALVAFGPVSVLALALFWPKPPAEPPTYAGQRYDQKLAQSYVKAGCWQCHSVTTLRTELAADFGFQAGGVRPVGPDLSGVGRKFHRDWHVAHFADPQAVTPGSQMPAQQQLFSDVGSGKLTKIGEDVVGFLLTLTVDGPTRDPWPEAAGPSPGGDPKTGASVYAQHCAGCHGVSGQGDGPAAGYFKSTRAPVKLAQGEFYRVAAEVALEDSLYASITQGVPGTGMPSFAERLTDQQRADVAAYIRTLAGK